MSSTDHLSNLMTKIPFIEVGSRKDGYLVVLNFDQRINHFVESNFRASISDMFELGVASDTLIMNRLFRCFDARIKFDMFLVNRGGCGSKIIQLSKGGYGYRERVLPDSVNLL